MARGHRNSNMVFELIQGISSVAAGRLKFQINARITKSDLIYFANFFVPGRFLLMYLVLPCSIKHLRRRSGTKKNLNLSEFAVESPKI